MKKQSKQRTAKTKLWKKTKKPRPYIPARRVSSIAERRIPTVIVTYRNTRARETDGGRTSLKRPASTGLKSLGRVGIAPAYNEFSVAGPPSRLESRCFGRLSR